MAMLALRLPSDIHYLGGRLHHRSSFMGGFYLGASCVLLFVFATTFFNDQIFLLLSFLSVGLPLALFWGFLIVELYCSFSHISYGFIFQLDPRDTLSVPQRAELLSFITFIVIFGLIMLSKISLMTALFLSYLVVLTVIAFPIRFYSSARTYVIRLFSESIFSLLRGPIRFRHFFFGDALMSLGIVFRVPVLIFTLYQVESHILTFAFRTQISRPSKNCGLALSITK